ncbi:Mov34/MPN/PAD-1 family protein [Lysinibacillus xylanilyticus]|uniref:hypothetical protein n=1 Tax=Lysinibacillus xylanilyticus TaxID=582475 RepID=UPI002B24F147|nr:hypothetical protein [Lysinibacillus xylanilyticus]MEB2301615.1 Mov34/MPN/PAD-1 family protein [Lysinibacillus xylanilyticus]
MKDLFDFMDEMDNEKTAEEGKTETVDTSSIEPINETIEKENPKEEIIEDEDNKQEVTTSKASLNDQDSFSVFVEENELAIKEKELTEAAAKAKTVAKATGKKSTAKKAEQPNTFAPTVETVIRYYGESIPITNYLSEAEIESKKITLNDLRSRMEEDYPELVANHTEMLFIEKKGNTFVVPTLMAKKKGKIVEPVASKVETRIPYEILGQFIALAQLFAKEELEIHADIYKNANSGKVFLDVPEQDVHKYFCETTESAMNIIDRIGMDSMKIAEIHSHHTLNALPSSTDDIAERVPNMLYIIVGNIDKFYPNVFCRMFVNDSCGWITFDAHEIFNRPSYALPSFDMKRIHIRKGE